MHLFDILRHYFAEYGYWTVAFVLLLENAGLPVPGETTLLFAGFLAYSEHHLKLYGIILAGVIAATLGDNLGYWIGHRGGRPLVEHQRRIFRISDRHLERGEEFFRRHGAFTVFFSRFVFGMRIIAGPLAGALRMPWRRFLVFNFLGATLWVSVIATLGYVFGSRWDWLTTQIERFDMTLVALIAIAALVWYWRRHRQQRNAKQSL